MDIQRPIYQQAVTSKGIEIGQDVGLIAYNDDPVLEVIKNGFQDYMKSIGKLGGQNKTPRLSNDRKIVDLLKTE